MKKSNLRIMLMLVGGLVIQSSFAQSLNLVGKYNLVIQSAPDRTHYNFCHEQMEIRVVDHKLTFSDLGDSWLYDMNPTPNKLTCYFDKDYFGNRLVFCDETIQKDGGFTKLDCAIASPFKKECPTNNERISVKRIGDQLRLSGVFTNPGEESAHQFNCTYKDALRKNINE